MYRLVSKLASENYDLHTLFVIFLTSKSRRTHIWCQKHGGVGVPCIWDYHVVLMATIPGGSLVYDFDSTLTFPVPVDIYLTEALKTPFEMNNDDYPIFRVIPAEFFMEHFASDRSHMRCGIDDWLVPPPSWPPIIGRAATSANNLQEYIDVERSDNATRGVLFDKQEFEVWLSAGSSFLGNQI